MQSETDAITAADHYRRATELQQQAREELVAATIRDRSSIRLKGLAARAGINERTLYTWINRGAMSNGRAPAQT